MKSTILFMLVLLLLSYNTNAQRPSTVSINDSLETINEITRNTPYMIVSYRGLNRFLGAKVASYLSDGGDLSLFGNYAVLNTESSRLSINHNVVRRNKNERVVALFTAGIRANIADAFATIVGGKEFSNDLGITLKYTKLGRGWAKFDTQRQKQAARLAPDDDGPQKRSANRKRAIILVKLEQEMNAERNDFIERLDNLDAGQLSSADELTVLQEEMRDEFYSDLEQRYVKKFAEDEAKILEERQSNNLVSAGWLAISAYLPVTTSTYSVAQSFATKFSDQEIYPWEFNVSYTRIFESRKYGRFFLHGSIGFVKNNSVLTEQITSVDLNDYKNLGGTDTLHYASLSSDKAYVGDFSDFITPIFRAQVIWFFSSSVGFSALVEKRTGTYDPVNAKFGIPVRLKGKDEDSFVNFELQAKINDWCGSIDPKKHGSDKMTYGISVGLPFSGLIN